MRAVTRKWINGGLESSSFSLTFILEGQVHHYIGTLVPAVPLRPGFLPVHIFDNDYDAQATQLTRAVRQLYVHLMPESER